MRFFINIISAFSAFVLVSGCGLTGGVSEKNPYGFGLYPEEGYSPNALVTVENYMNSAGCVFDDVLLLADDEEAVNLFYANVDKIDVGELSGLLREKGESIRFVYAVTKPAITKGAEVAYLVKKEFVLP